MVSSHTEVECDKGLGLASHKGLGLASHKKFSLEVITLN